MTHYIFGVNPFGVLDLGDVHDSQVERLRKECLLATYNILRIDLLADVVVVAQIAVFIKLIRKLILFPTALLFVSLVIARRNGGVLDRGRP